MTLPGEQAAAALGGEWGEPVRPGAGARRRLDASISVRFSPEEVDLIYSATPTGDVLGFIKKAALDAATEMAPTTEVLSSPEHYVRQEDLTLVTPAGNDEAVAKMIRRLRKRLVRDADFRDERRSAPNVHPYNGFNANGNRHS